MVNGVRQIVPFSSGFDKDLVEMPLPLRRLSHSFRPALADLICEMDSETIYPVPNRSVADIDPSLMEKVLDVAQGQRESDVHHHR